MVSNVGTFNEFDGSYYSDITDRDAYLEKFSVLVDRIPQDTTLHRLLLECHESVVNPEVQIPSDGMVADVMLEVLEELLRPETAVLDVDSRGFVADVSYQNPLFDKVTFWDTDAQVDYTILRGKEYLSQVEAVFRLYKDSPLLRNLQDRVAGMLNYCAVSTNKDIESITQLLSRKQELGTPLMAIDIAETIGASLKFLISHREGSLKSPLLTIFGSGTDVKLRIPGNKNSSKVGKDDGGMDILDIQKILQEMANFFDAGKDKLETRNRMLKLVSLLMLLSLLATSCAPLIPGGGGPDANVQPLDDGDNDNKTPTITATPSITPTVIATLTPPPTKTPLPTKTPTLTAQEYCDTLPDDKLTKTFLDELLPEVFEHRVLPPEGSIVEVIDTHWNATTNRASAGAIAQMLDQTSNGRMPNLCDILNETGPLAITSWGIESPFKSGELIISPEFVKEMERQGVSLFLLLMGKPDVLLPDGDWVRLALINAKVDEEVANKVYPAEGIRTVRLQKQPGPWVLHLHDIQTIYLWPTKLDLTANEIVEGADLGEGYIHKIWFSEIKP